MTTRKLYVRLLFHLSKRRYLAMRSRRLPRGPFDLTNPAGFNEKLNAYKLDSWPNTLMPRLADKVAVKDFVSERIGREHVIPTYWHGTVLPPRTARDWPAPFVVKSRHGWAQTICVHMEPDWPRIERETATWLRKKHGRFGYEWPYLHIPPGIFVEQYVGKGSVLPYDYKFFCFDGSARMIQVDVARGQDPHRAFVDLHWRALPFTFGKPPRGDPPPRPDTLGEMIRIAEELAKDIPFVRVDLYNVGGQILFGEMTFFPNAGFGRFHPPEAEAAVSDYWNYDRAAVRALP